MRGTLFARPHHAHSPLPLPLHFPPPPKTSASDAAAPKDEDAVAVARFLRTTPGLSRAVIGDLLGEPAPRALAVLDAYARSFPWAGACFEGSLRSFLGGFRLPGEAQKIYRVLDAWSQAYYSANAAPGPGGGRAAGAEEGGAAAATASSSPPPLQPPPLCAPAQPAPRPPSHPTFAFASADAVHVLAFSAILLNTDAHTVAVKRKMNAAEFVANNRGINGGADLPAPFLEALYTSITAKPIRVPAPPPTGGAGAVEEGGGCLAAALPSVSGGGGGSSPGPSHGAPPSSSSALARLGSRRSKGGGWGLVGVPPPSPPPPVAGGGGRPSSAGGGGGWLLAGSGGSGKAGGRRRGWLACLGQPA